MRDHSEPECELREEFVIIELYKTREGVQLLTLKHGEARAARLSVGRPWVGSSVVDVFFFGPNEPRIVVPWNLAIPDPPEYTDP